MLLLYFCLFVDFVNKPIIFDFEAFVYNFNNTISIIATIFYMLKYAEKQNAVKGLSHSCYIFSIKNQISLSVSIFEKVISIR